MGTFHRSLFGVNNVDLESGSATAVGAADLELDERVASALRALLPTVAGETVAAIIVEVPSYASDLSGQMGTNISAAVEMALGGFLKLASRSRDADPSTPLRPALEAAYALGRGEARGGRGGRRPRSAAARRAAGARWTRCWRPPGSPPASPGGRWPARPPPPACR